MEPYANLQRSLLGLHCNDPKFLTELQEVQTYYDFYEGRPFMIEDDPTIGKGQLWPVKDRDYKPTREIRNITRKLMNKQGRFMTSVSPTLVVSSTDVTNREKLDVKRGLIENILAQEKFWNKFSKAFMDATIGKRVLLTILTEIPNKKIPDTHLKFRFYTMNEFTYEYDPIDCDKLIRVQIAYQDENTVGKIQQNQRWYKWVYEMRDDSCWCTYEVVDGTDATAYIENVIYDESGKEVGKEDIPLKQEWNTGLDELPCKVIYNDGLTGDLRGRSDIKDLMDMAMDYNKTLSDYRDALRFKMFEQPVFTDCDSGSIKNIKIAPNAIVDLKSDPSLGNGTGSSVAKFGMLSSTFNFQTTADSYLQQLKNDMYELMEQPLPDQVANVPSGKALKMIYYDLISRCEDKWKAWDEALEWLVDMIIKLIPLYNLYSDMEGIETITIPSIHHWSHNYPIPDDEIDDKTIAIQEVQANVRSHKSYIEEFGNSEDADAEFDTIISELETINGAANNMMGVDETVDNTGEASEDEEEEEDGEEKKEDTKDDSEEEE